MENLKEKFKKEGYKWVETEDKLIYKKKFLIFNDSKIEFHKRIKTIYTYGCGLNYEVVKLIEEQAKELNFDKGVEEEYENNKKKRI